MKSGFALRLPILATVLAVTAADSARAVPLYGVSFTSAQGSVIHQIDPQTALASEPKPTGLDHIVGIAFGAGGTLYGLTNATAPAQANSLVRLNPSTGSSQLVGSTGLGDVAEGDLAFDRTTGSLYGLYSLAGGGRRLFTLNTATGAATLLPVSLSGDPSAMAFDAAGSLYVLDTALARLLSVDKTTGATSASIPLSSPLGSVAGMAIDPLTGMIYVADGDDGGTDHLYSLNSQTGVLIDIGPTGLVNGLAGLTFLPEPASIALMAVAATFFARRRTAV